jgi:hypothetical protein
MTLKPGTADLLGYLHHGDSCAVAFHVLHCHLPRLGIHDLMRRFMTESLRFRFGTISAVYTGGQIRELDRLLVMFPNYTMHTDLLAG